MRQEVCFVVTILPNFFALKALEVELEVSLMEAVIFFNN